jgi:hypothetical protein
MLSGLLKHKKRNPLTEISLFFNLGICYFDLCLHIIISNAQTCLYEDSFILLLFLAYFFMQYQL